MTLAPFPDIELAVVDLLALLANAGTVTPADLQARLPFHKVHRFGGSDDRITDTARVDVDTFAADHSGRVAAEAVRQVLLAGPHRVGAVVLDRVLTASAPVEVPYGGTGVRRWTASYQISARR